EALPKAVVARRVLGEQLDRHRPVELRVAREVHGGHPPVTERPFQPVAPAGDASSTHSRDFYPSVQVFPADLLQRGESDGSLPPKGLTDMKRILLLLGLVAAVLAVPATAAAFNGVVVAKQPKRDALVIASRSGVVRTVRASARRVRTIRTGQRLFFSAKRLSDGTFAARALRVTGRARRAVLHGTVVRQRAGHILRSTGGRLVTVRSSARGFAAGNGRHRPGDVVLANVSVTRNGLRASSIRTIGHSDGLELEGIFLGLNG